MGKFVVALVLFELVWIINISYTHSFPDGYNSLYELAGPAYDDLYPLRHYSSIDPYRNVGLGHSEPYHTGGYNSLYDIDDVDNGNLYRRYRSLGSYQRLDSRYLGSYNDIGGYNNLRPYNLGGYSIGNDVGLLSYLPNKNRLNEDQYYPGVYSFGDREVRSRPRRRNTHK